jgi:hypothetical protein
MSHRNNRTVIIQSQPELETKNLDLTKNDLDPELPTSESHPVQVPPKSLYGSNLKKIKSFKKLRRGYKLQNQKSIFLHDLRELLRNFDVIAHKYDDSLLIEILNISESFFIYGKTEDREQIKKECIFDIMLPYFANDSDLLAKTITHVWRHVSKSTLRRRLWSKFKIFFFQK